MAVHFQRVEFLVAQAFGLDLLAAEDPPLGFGIEAAQLVAHPLDSGFHLIQGDVRIVDLLFDSATEDRCFTGQVDQIVEQLRRDLDHVRAGIGRRRQRLGLGRGRRRNRRGRFRHGRMAKVLDRIDQAIGRRHRLTGAGRIEHLRQAVMAALQQREQRLRRLQHAGGQAFVEELQFMGQITNRGDFHHARTALEGVQVAQQGFHLLTTRRLGLPALKRRPGAFDNVETFLEEDLQQFSIVRSRVAAGRLPGPLGDTRMPLTVGTNGFDQLTGIVQRLVELQLFKVQRQSLMALFEQHRQ
ncbi:hypothetical protein PS673_05775 [Pseudomonas fluorescens]|uniref:Uncharacterized protein n=1 Tax=Pseudomonas fluorescens TaxID=294 RepID=A0A5E6Y0L9_PSEFL|nr:hypothetical protein PS673_05745 [Pseudomonas fluorescens]VVN46269.1 hypothetical protein PS673_05775 [Pseudomonas fluorescens]